MATKIIKSTWKQLVLHANNAKMPSIFVTKKMVQQPEPSKLHFYLPLAVIGYVLLYGVVFLHYESTGSLDWNEWPNSPYIFSHQLAYKPIWAQCDLVIALNILETILVFVFLLRTAPITRIYLINEHKDKICIGENAPLSEDVQFQLIRLKQKINLICHIFNLYLSAMAVICYGYVYANSVYTLNVGSLLFWMIAMPCYGFYTAYAFSIQISHVLYLLSEIIQIRQQSIQHKFVKLNQNFATHKSFFLKYWRFKCLNRGLLHICGQTREYARACRWRLSHMFPSFIGLQCYFMYVVCFVSSKSGHFKTPLLSTVVLFNLQMLWLVEKCASLTKNYRRIEQENQKFWFNFIRIYKRYECRCIGNLIKVETLQTHRRLHPYAFCVFGMRRITSKTYDVILSYTSAFFLFVIKNQYG